MARSPKIKIVDDAELRQEIERNTDLLSQIEDLERFAAMEIVDHNQTAAILLKPDVFKALMKYIDQMDHNLEQAQVEAIFEHRKDTSEYLSGEELAVKAKESFREGKENLREFLDGNQ